MKEKIAIIGLGCVFPDALDFTQYWQNIVEGKNSIREVEPEFWRAEEFYDPDPSVPDKTYCKVGGMAGPIEFDTKEFGVSPKAMEHTSVEQLFSLVVARQALIDAGYYGSNARPFNKEKTGVIISAPVGGNAFHLCSRNAAPKLKTLLVNNGIPDAAADLIIQKYLQGLNDWSEDDNPGYIPNVVAGRIANRFNLGGTCCSVDAACGSSMGAIKFAVDELQSGNCDVMLCGGANLDNSSFAYISFCKTPAISKTSKIKPFDESADGMLLGDGVGMMVLKRLSDAERDGDKIYAVICGSGASSDGRAKSIYAPSKEGQLRCLKRAYANAGVDMDTVGLLEAHGTGTAAGDACEVSAIVDAFPKSNQRRTVIGSVKSQVGHMRMAAGIGGAMKIALALYHKVLPTSINMKNPNPALLDSRLTVLQKSMPWIVNDAQPVRRAGVSAFGFGGTNFHVVMEEYKPEHDGAYRVGAAPIGVLLTADTKEALAAKIEALASDANAFRNNEYRYENAGNSQFRLAFVARSPAEVDEKCTTALALLARSDADSFTQKGITYNAKTIDSKVTVLFPGQGTQAVNMLSEVAINYPELRNAVGAADNVLLGQGAAPISEILYPKALTADELDAAQTAINSTANTQPALAAVEAGLYEIVTKRGLTADFFIGHSFGELVALWADGVVAFDTLIAMAKERGSLMSKADPNAAMMAVMTDKESLRAICADFENVYVANENSPGQTVVSGSADAIGKLEEKLAAMGIRAVRLKVSGAFHSPYMKEASAAFRAYLNNVNLGKSTGTVIANATGEGYKEQVAELLEKQLLNPVLFRSSVEYAYAAGSRIFIEIGNGKVLSNLVKECLAGKDVVSIALCPEKSKDSAEQLEFAMAQLAALGIRIQDDPYRMRYNDELIIKKSKTTYTVTMKGFFLPQKQQSMDDSVLPDQKIIDMIRGGAPTPIANRTGADANAAVLREFMDVQTAQMQAAANMLSSVRGESERQNVLACITAFQNNAMRALEVYFANQTGKTLAAAIPAGMPNPVQAMPVAVEEIATPAAVSKNDRNVSELLLAVISDKTGYPADMIDTDMELESDLGIDSIKRVEILSELNKELGEIFTAEDVTNLATMSSICEIAAYLNSIADAAPQTQAETPVEQTDDAPSAAIEMVVLECISDKTGYPVDMIDVTMELESDLGIDSIKRVEIIAAVFSTLNCSLTPEEIGELSELTDIQSIVAYLAEKI